MRGRRRGPASGKRPGGRKEGPAGRKARQQQLHRTGMPRRTRAPQTRLPSLRRTRHALAHPTPMAGALPPDAIDEVLLVMSWFRRHPQALRRTTPPEEWLA